MKPQYFSNIRDYSLFHPIAEELQLNQEQNYFFDLSYLSILDVTGDNAQNFLQGQISADINKLTQNNMIKGALCNLKGRVISLMDVIEYQGLKLVLPDDLIELVTKDLSKPAMFSRVKFNKNTEYKIFGCYYPNKEQKIAINLPQSPFEVTHTENYCAYNYDNDLYLIIIQPDFQDFFNSLNNENIRGSLCWHYLRIKQKLVEIYPTTSGLFLPHKIDLHLNDYLSFDKGCYKGQEIIARMHYKAKSKYQLQLHKHNDNNIVLGENLKSNDTNIAGEVVDYVTLPDNTYLVITSDKIK